MIKDCKINFLEAEEILDSKGMPTVEAKLRTDSGIFRASVPSGVSTGKYEAVELRDEDGRGVKKAIENIEKIIAPAFKNENLTDQRKIDEILIDLDGTKNKSRLGANAILAVSMVFCRAISKFKKLPLYRYISQIAGEEIKMPLASFNMIEGGKHGEGDLSFQEFMVLPRQFYFSKDVKAAKEIHKSLKRILEKKFGKKEVGLSKEGAFWCRNLKTEKAIELILEAAKISGKGKLSVGFVIDAAASGFYRDNKYLVDGNLLTKDQLADFYINLSKKYPIISLEDPFAEDDEEGWTILKNKPDSIIYEGPDSYCYQKPIVIGDDLTVTNLERIKTAHEKGICNGLIVKPNQVGTVTETIEAVKLAKSFDWKIMISNRGGETKDDFIADFAAGVGAEFIKSGAPFPKERMVKYNRLMEIEKEILRK